MPTNFHSVLNGDKTDASHANQFILPVQRLEAGLAYWAGATTGSSTAYTAGLNPAASDNIEGTIVNFLVHATCGEEPTLALNSHDALPLKSGGEQLAAGDLVAGSVAQAICAGSAWHVIGKAATVSAEMVQAQLYALGYGGVADASLTPSYLNTGGQGDRTAEIAVTASAGLFVHVGVDSRLVDGSFYFDNYFDTVDVSDHWIQFDFGEPVFITEARWFQLAEAATHGTWQWQGSNNDGATWSNIGSTFVLDTASNVTIAGKPYGAQLLTELDSNTFQWSSYRMKGVSGIMASPSSYVFEIEFKIDR